MGYLINSKYLFLFNIVEKDGQKVISLIAHDAEKKSKFDIFESTLPGFLNYHEAVKKFIDSNDCADFCSDFFEIIIKQIKCYSNNLYGFYLNDEASGKDEWLAFFKEAYISCFAFEMSSFFFGLSNEQKVLLESELHRKLDAGSEYYSEVLTLGSFFRQWKLIERKH